MPTPRARQEWANRVRAEYRSAAITAQVLQWCIRFGLPRSLLDTAHRIVGDELDHAELSHACLQALGGGDAPIGLEQAELAPRVSGDGALADLLDTLLHGFLFGETLAVPLFGAMRRETTQPQAHAALDRILRDEAVHRAFGWDLLDALLALDAVGVRARLATRLPLTVRDFASTYGSVPEGPPLTDEERAAGLLPSALYRQIFAETCSGDLTRRFGDRGISMPGWT